MLYAQRLEARAAGELGRQLLQAVEDALGNNRSVRGRELQKQILVYYSTGQTADSLFSMNDLQKIRSQPFSVVLFDEIEKASPVFFDTLLGVLDEGVGETEEVALHDRSHCSCEEMC